MKKGKAANTPRRRAEKRLAGLLSAARDTAGRKRAEVTVIRAKEEWEMTFNSVPDLIAILDDRYRIARVNRAMAERLDRKPEECIGLACYSVVHGTTCPPSICPYSKTLADHREHTSEIHDLRLGGDFLISTTPLLAQDGKMVGVVHVARDISEQKRAKAEIERLNADLTARAVELESANRELEAFNYTVAHDLRKPLTVINGYCQAIRELWNNKLDPQSRAYLQEIYDGTLRMHRLIEDLLNFSRLAHADLHWVPVDLSLLAHEVAAELRLADLQRRVTFRIAEGISAVGDPGMLRMALDNLLGNAWKYTDSLEEAVIEFGTAEIDGKPVCFVRDNGPGFDMADVDKLFTPFKRLPGAEEHKGFGIGLATVDRIIRRHSGRVWAEGAPDKGATFYFTLAP